MAAQFDARCLSAATAAAKRGGVSEQEVLDAFQKVAFERDRMAAAGEVTGRDARLRRFAANKAEELRIEAARQRRNAARNILVREQQDATLDLFLADGMDPVDALRATLEGTNRGVGRGRVSAETERQAHKARYLGGLMNEIQAEKPHIERLLGDEKLDADVLAEMIELKPDGKPGKTGNADAIWLAKTFAKYAELARTDLNKLGASIGKLQGWAGVQSHDNFKMIAAGKEAWVGYITTKLSMKRTFPDGQSPGEVAEILGDMYDTIITGLSKKPTAGETGQRVGPANLAKSLGKHRVLHFEDAEAAGAYQKEFGFGNTITGMLSHLSRTGEMAGNMSALGPNPEVMFTALTESMKRKVKESARYTPKEKDRYSSLLTTEAGKLRHALDVATGTVNRPVNVTAARVFSDIRKVQSMSKLGAAMWSALGGDAVTAAMSAQFRGGNFFASLGRQWGGIMRIKQPGATKEIAYLYGAGFDGMIGNIVSPYVSQDGPHGWLSRMQTGFFKWNGLTWATENQRVSAAHAIGAEMGMRAQVDYADLPAKYRHVLDMNGIDAARWDIMRQSVYAAPNGNRYVTPDQIRELPDEAFEPLVADRLARAKSDAAKAKIIDDARRDVEISLLRFVADETNYSILTTDARTQRYTTGGQRPGTRTGEAMRMISQFKGFPLVFTQRILGRAVHGHRKDAGMGERGAHVGALIAGLIMAGYASMTAKDVLKGYWPPRDPGDPRTWMAAMQQGGGFGIYGDFLFASHNRFGGGPLETIAGPGIGSAADLVKLGLQARDWSIDVSTGEQGRFSGAETMSWAQSNIPYANLWFTKPALDILVLNSMREALSPGYLKRARTRRSREYGQTPLLPQTLGQ